MSSYAEQLKDKYNIIKDKDDKVNKKVIYQAHYRTEFIEPQ